MKRKNIALEEPTHERVTQLGKKNESYDDIIVRLLNEQPYIMPLKLALSNYELANKKAMTYDGDNPTERGNRNRKAKTCLGDLLRQLGHFIDHVDGR